MDGDRAKRKKKSKKKKTKVTSEDGQVNVWRLYISSDNAAVKTTMISHAILFILFKFMTCNENKFTDKFVLLFCFQMVVPDDNLDLLLENLEKSSSLSLQNEGFGGSDRRSVLHVEHR